MTELSFARFNNLLSFNSDSELISKDKYKY